MIPIITTVIRTAGYIFLAKTAEGITDRYFGKSQIIQVPEVNQPSLVGGDTMLKVVQIGLIGLQAAKSGLGKSTDKMKEEILSETLKEVVVKVDRVERTLNEGLDKKLDNIKSGLIEKQQEVDCKLIKLRLKGMINAYLDYYISELPEFPVLRDMKLMFNLSDKGSVEDLIILCS